MPKRQLTPFREKVLERVEKIPEGKVATCAQIGGGALANVPEALRWLAENGYPDMPWHRVVSKSRRQENCTLLKIKIGDEGQAAKLHGEQVRLLLDGQVDSKFLVECK